MKRGQRQQPVAIGLETEVMQAMLEASPAQTPSPEATARMLSRLQQRVGASADAQYFVFADHGVWKELMPGVRSKLLHKAGVSQAFMLTLAAGVCLPAHQHTRDEETFVLAGEVWLDGVHCRTGDYHFAQAGTSHKEVRTADGCTLLVKSF